MRYPRLRWILVNVLAIGAVIALALSPMSGGGRLAALAAIFICYSAVIAAAVASPAMEMFVRWWRHGDRNDPRIALTFDDGPDPHATGKLLDLLAERNVKATFFCIGRRVEQSPDLARRIVAEGHDIGNHTYSHRWWTSMLFSRPLRNELLLAQQSIRSAVGFEARWFRPPMGLTNPHFGPQLAKQGLVCVGWNIRPFDRLGLPDRVAARVTRRLRPGVVVLLHDGGADVESLCAMVKLILDAADQRGLRSARISDLMTPPVA